MASLEEIRAGIAQTIKNYAAMPLATYPTVPDVIESPAIVVEPLSANYTALMRRGGDTWEFHIYVLIARTNAEEDQNVLDQLVDGNGPSSIRQIIYEHSDLGLNDQITDSIITGMHGYGGSHEYYKTPHIGAVLKIRVETGAA